MKSRKIIDNLVPFTDIWYNICFNHAFFPIVSYFGQNINYFLCYNVFSFQSKKTSMFPLLELTDLHCNTIVSLSTDLGITMQTQKTNDIVNELIEAINSDKPVILDVDCFYESFRLDAYQKKHFGHDILFHGYDKVSEVFYIIEHDFRESLQFKERTISFEDTKNAYYGYLENINDNNNFYTFSYNPNLNKVRNFNYSEHYKNNYEQFIDTILSSETQILSFRDELIKNLETTDFEKYFPILLESLNNIVNQKRIQQYSLLKIFSLPENLANQLDNTISIWSTIRGIIFKSVLIANFNPTYINKVCKQLSTAYEEERKLNKLLFDFFNK